MNRTNLNAIVMSIFGMACLVCVVLEIPHTVQIFFIWFSIAVMALAIVCIGIEDKKQVVTPAVVMALGFGCLFYVMSRAIPNAFLWTLGILDSALVVVVNALHVTDVADFLYSYDILPIRVASSNSTTVLCIIYLMNWLLGIFFIRLLTPRIAWGLLRVWRKFAVGRMNWKESAFVAFIARNHVAILWSFVAVSAIGLTWDSMHLGGGKAVLECLIVNVIRVVDVGDLFRVFEPEGRIFGLFDLDVKAEKYSSHIGKGIGVMFRFCAGLLLGKFIAVFLTINALVRVAADSSLTPERRRKALIELFDLSHKLKKRHLLPLAEVAITAPFSKPNPNMYVDNAPLGELAQRLLDSIDPFWPRAPEIERLFKENRATVRVDISSLPDKNIVHIMITVEDHRWLAFYVDWSCLRRTGRVDRWSPHKEECEKALKAYREWRSVVPMLVTLTGTKVSEKEVREVLVRLSIEVSDKVWTATFAKESIVVELRELCRITDLWEMPVKQVKAIADRINLKTLNDGVLGSFPSHIYTGKSEVLLERLKQRLKEKVEKDFRRKADKGLGGRG